MAPSSEPESGAADSVFQIGLVPHSRGAMCCTGEPHDPGKVASYLRHGRISAKSNKQYTISEVRLDGFIMTKRNERHSLADSGHAGSPMDNTRTRCTMANTRFRRTSGNNHTSRRRA